LFYLLFRIFFHYPISKMFRKYYFLSVLLFMFFSGNIEQFSFYFFQELLLFFSAGIAHKIANVVLLFLLYFTIFMCIGCYFWTKSYYKKHARYFIDNYGLKLMGLICCSIDNGLMCLCFGAIHSLLLPFPRAQLIMLMLFESLWICERVFNLSVYRIKYMVWV
jgi:hypothetical protein